MLALTPTLSPEEREKNWRNSDSGVQAAKFRFRNIFRGERGKKNFNFFGENF